MRKEFVMCAPFLLMLSFPPLIDFPLGSFILWIDRTGCILTQSSWRCQRSNRRALLLPVHQFSRMGRIRNDEGNYIVCLQDSLDGV